MTKLSDYMKGNFDMKTFNHMPLQALPEVYTETINRKRFYVTPDGNKYPSITTVLSGRNAEGLIKWRERVGNDVANQIMRTAAKRGTAVHELAENYLNNEELSQQDVLPLAMFTLLKPELDNINNIVLQEGALYSDKWGVAGRVDCIAEYDGKITVIDFKTSTKEKKEEWVENYFIQCTAYCEMFEERYGLAINQIAILIVTEDGTVQTFVKDKKDYLPLLQPVIDNFWKEQELDKLMKKHTWLKYNIELYLTRSEKKRLNLPHGQVGYRKQPFHVEVLDENELISGGFVRTKESVDRKSILTHFKATGEIPQGCEIERPEDKLYVKPSIIKKGE